MPRRNVDLSMLKLLCYNYLYLVYLYIAGSNDKLIQEWWFISISIIHRRTNNIIIIILWPASSIVTTSPPVINYSQPCFCFFSLCTGRTWYFIHFDIWTILHLELRNDVVEKNRRKKPLQLVFSMSSTYCACIHRRRRRVFCHCLNCD